MAEPTKEELILMKLGKISKVLAKVSEDIAQLSVELAGSEVLSKVRLTEQQRVVETSWREALATNGASKISPSTIS